MCGTCKFCLGFFQIAAVGSFGLMLTVTAIFYNYGGMPPTFAMAIGFWIQYAAGWLSIYLTFYIVRVLGRGLFTSWTPKYCFILIIVVIVLYMAGSICFFVPVSKDRMIEYSQWYNSAHNRIPQFLDKFQDQYQCCGINNYMDYNDPEIFGHKGDSLSRQVYHKLTPDDPNWVRDQKEYIKELQKTKKDEDPKMRTHLYFDIPKTCCKYSRRIIYKHCGKFVEYRKTSNLTKVQPNSIQMINNVTSGCFEKYQLVMSNSVFQLNWLIGIVQWGSLAQSVMFFILIWIYRLSLRAMKRNLKSEILEEGRLSHDEEGKPLTSKQNKLKKVNSKHSKDEIELIRASSNVSFSDDNTGANSNTPTKN